MNIYFSCPITGGREYQPIFEIMVDHLLSREHEVPTEHLARPEVMSLESVADPEDVFQRDIAWINECEAMIAEVSIPSHGVGYEIAYAVSVEKPVLCCSRRGVPVSKMITGNNSPSLVVRTYGEDEEVLELIDMFLSDVQDTLADT
jgi:nucleoside 2-deoxyribosyltransferase